MEALAYELCGTVVREVDDEGAVGRDGRLRPGDLVLFLNQESMWRVTSSQAKIILRRAEFVSTGIPYEKRPFFFFHFLNGSARLWGNLWQKVKVGWAISFRSAAAREFAQDRVESLFLCVLGIAAEG